MNRYNIRHITQYNYIGPVYDSISQIKLYAIEDENQKVLNHKIILSEHTVVSTFKDIYYNQLGIFSIIPPHNNLTILSDLSVELQEIPIPVFIKPAHELWHQMSLMKSNSHFNKFLFVEKSITIKDIVTCANALLDEKKNPFENAMLLSEYIYKNFEYRQGITSIETEIDEIWKLKAGVCQDFAHLLLDMLRIIGIPARYVSGYICPKYHEFRGEGATHAWVEIFLPDKGWVGIDPTNNCFASDKHVRLAVGRDFYDCSPVKGVYKGEMQHTLEVTVTVSPYDNQIHSKENTLYKLNDLLSIETKKAAYTQENTTNLGKGNLYWEHQQNQKKIQMQQQQQ